MQFPPWKDRIGEESGSFGAAAAMSTTDGLSRTLDQTAVETPQYRICATVIDLTRRDRLLD